VAHCDVVVAGGLRLQLWHMLRQYVRASVDAWAVPFSSGNVEKAIARNKMVRNHSCGHRQFACVVQLETDPPVNPVLNTSH
jgi:hypothetical protein